MTNYFNTAYDILYNYPANLTQQVYVKLQSYQQCVNGDNYVLTDACPRNYLNISAFDAGHHLNVIAANLDCSRISSNWLELTGTNTFDGVFTFCLKMYITAGFLFATICVT